MKNVGPSAGSRTSCLTAMLWALCTIPATAPLSQRDLVSLADQLAKQHSNGHAMVGLWPGTNGFVYRVPPAFLDPSCGTEPLLLFGGRDQKLPAKIASSILAIADQRSRPYYEKPLHSKALLPWRQEKNWAWSIDAYSSGLLADAVVDALPYSERRVATWTEGETPSFLCHEWPAVRNGDKLGYPTLPNKHGFFREYVKEHKVPFLLFSPAAMLVLITPALWGPSRPLLSLMDPPSQRD